MAEVVGLATGVLGLVGLATTAIEGLKYIQFARSFGEEYERAQLKIDIHANRLSRWNEAIQTSDLKIEDREKKMAAETLIHINKILDDAMQFSTGIPQVKEKEVISASSVDVLQLHDENSLKGHFRAMHDALAKITKRRQKETSLAKKTKWAIFGRDKFQQMDGDLDRFVTYLENCIRASDPVLEQIAQKEAEEIRSQDNSECAGISLLQSVSDQSDDKLEKAVAKVVSQSYGHTYYDTVCAKDASVRFGNHFTPGFSIGKIPEGQIGSHKYIGTKILPMANAHLGDFYGDINFDHK